MSCGGAELLRPTDRAGQRVVARRGPRRALRVALPAVALIVLTVIGVLCAFRSPIAFDMLRLWGVHPPVDHPFLDLRYIFAGIECWDKGVNVYLSNPCDPLGRPHGYSPLWLRLAFLPSQNWTPLVGILIDALFALSLAAFPPPQDRRELALMLAAVLSPPVAFALQRSNVDVIMFLALLLAAWLWVRQLRWRLLAYSVITFAGLLKFYPLIVLGLAARERIRVFAAICALCGVILLGFVSYFHVELIEMARNIPTGGYFIGDMFGAKNLPNGILVGRFGNAGPWLGIVLWGGLLAMVAKRAVTTASHLLPQRAIAELDPMASALLLFGAAVICGCFFAGQSVGYRGIFLLFTLPGILGLRRRSVTKPIRRLATAACALVLFLLWQGVLTWNGQFSEVLQQWLGATIGTDFWMVLWAARELAWWLLTGTLTGIILCFVADSPTGSAVRLVATHRFSAKSR